jgi:glycosyltransferase involved in cell wall biosynthesis
LSNSAHDPPPPRSGLFGPGLTPIASDELRLSVVVPCYNEAATIETLLRRVAGERTQKEIVVVDDGSTDASASIVERLADGGFLAGTAVRLIRHQHNQGKGAALKTGFSAAQGNVVVIQDADLEYDPEEYSRLLRPIVEGKADVVFGSRFLVREYARVHLYSHYLGNRFLTLVSNLFTGLNLTDMETCYKMFRTEVVHKLQLKSRRFDVEPEITAKVARLRCRVYEVPISYSGRDFAEGKKISWRDGFAALLAIVRFRFTD